MPERFTIEIDDAGWGGGAEGMEAEMLGVEVVDGDADRFWALMGGLAVRPPQAPEDAPEPSHRLEAVVGRLRHGDDGFQTLIEFVVRHSDGTSGLWTNGGDWREPMDAPDLESAVEHDLDQFWADVRTGELDMTADPDPPPVFWYGLDDPSRAALGTP